MTDRLSSRKEFIDATYDRVATERDSWIQRNSYYYDYLKKVLSLIVEPDSKVLQLKCETGYYLNATAPRDGLGLDASKNMVEIARRNYPHLRFETTDPENIQARETFDYILLVNALGDVVDVQRLLQNLKSAAEEKTRVVIINYNALWQPLINLANLLKLKIKQPTQNWLTAHDTENLLDLAGYEVIKQFNILLCPVRIPLLASFLNRFIARLPIIQKLCLNNIFIARRVDAPRLDAPRCSVSVIIPCKNEKENIGHIIKEMPEMGAGTEMIFCDDQSDDGTADEVRRLQKIHTEKNIKLTHGPGICKSKNVMKGFEAASGDILMIFDADSTVMAQELPYFYAALAENKAEFINGCRLVYTMEEDSMTLTKMIGNKILSMIFSYILDQKIKDTLCGTKVFWRRDLARIKRYFGTWGLEDRWGDFDLIFSATKIHLKIIDMPVHYFERVHGTTKMKNVALNGTRMLWMSLAALKKLKFF